MDEMLRVEIIVKARAEDGREFAEYLWRVGLPRDYFERLEAAGIRGMLELLQTSRAARGKELL